MGSPIDLRLVAPEWLDFFDRIVANPTKTILLTYASKREAESARFDYYRVRNAVLKETKCLNIHNDETGEENYYHIRHTEVRLDPKTFTLTFQAKSETNTVNVLRKFLADNPDPTKEA